ncbi:murein hydrolase activator EnvC family protein [Azospirillum picis]|uniref:Septal ring factor EnvC (AmiA/AmiB activator) n=1 Tax=Azospirillum picis TaxID=488438 RepID=A0ABU0MLA0_9PROT|nr:peptidoglycan DD-metalloendopeptidase family protein [Azospirillum picis]MBP2300140.1 septal ring factor EnvC (AmiA/AmiB activator) [Azospirillum picis]MDQ0534018.1 septal ring factor EnvC (AmiA/AmiB activator) [Azospirillum picis]
MAPVPCALDAPSLPRGERGAWRDGARGPGGGAVSRAGEGLAAGFVLAAALCLAQPADAQGQGDAPKDALKRVEQQMQTGKDRQQQLEHQSQALQAELDDLRGRLIGLADQARDQEQALGGLEESLTALEAEERERSASLDAERRQIAALLAALQRLARIPPEAALARPESPVDTLRSALLLRDAVPALRARSDALAKALEALADTRGKLVDRRAKALAAQVALAEKQGEMNRLIARREELSRQTEEERVQVARRMADLSGQAADLRQLMERIEAERRAAAEAAARKEAERREAERREAERRLAEQREAERRLAARKEAERKDAERKLAELRAAEQKAAEEKAMAERQAKEEAERERKLAARAPSRDTGNASQADGMLLPVAGKLTTRYGETDRYGVASRGVTLQARAGATVVAPRGGTIVFAGPFKGYGLILIVEHGNGYHSLIAGLGRIETAVGRKVAGGEPLAVMPADGEPDLYFELRRNGHPINPQRGFGAPEGKGQG